MNQEIYQITEFRHKSLQNTGAWLSALMGLSGYEYILVGMLAVRKNSKPRATGCAILSARGSACCRRHPARSTDRVSRVPALDTILAAAVLPLRQQGSLGTTPSSWPLRGAELTGVPDRSRFPLCKEMQIDRKLLLKGRCWPISAVAAHRNSVVLSQQLPS